MSNTYTKADKSLARKLSRLAKGGLLQPDQMREIVPCENARYPGRPELLHNCSSVEDAFCAITGKPFDLDGLGLVD